MASLFSDFLTALGVRHTEAYSDSRFADMPFQSLYGLYDLLREYGVDATAVQVPEQERRKALASLPKPFLADTPDGFAVVTRADSASICYLSQHQCFTVSSEQLAAGWNGIALIATPRPEASEPNYRRHRIAELAAGVKRVLLVVLAVLLAGYAIWVGDLWRHWAAWAVIALDCAGLWLSWMLVLKSLGIHTKAADAVCSALEEGGCDEIARSEAASFLGIFKWSEVGLAYFGVSLLALLLFPAVAPELAAINILCLPYAFWSIWYQRFKAKAWCTLCLGVQAVLWLLGGVYLAGGYTAAFFPLTLPRCITFVVLGACYILALLAINKADNSHH